jgi:hypothetical protein
MKTDILGANPRPTAHDEDGGGARARRSRLFELQARLRDTRTGQLVVPMVQTASGNMG